MGDGGDRWQRGQHGKGKMRKREREYSDGELVYGGSMEGARGQVKADKQVSVDDRSYRDPQNVCLSLTKFFPSSPKSFFYSFRSLVSL